MIETDGKRKKSGFSARWQYAPNAGYAPAARSWVSFNKAVNPACALARSLAFGELVPAIAERIR
jgi:hypothetical protein